MVGKVTFKMGPLKCISNFFRIFEIAVLCYLLKSVQKFWFDGFLSVIFIETRKSGQNSVEYSTYILRSFLCWNWTLYVEYRVFITAFVLQDAWSPMIISDPDPTHQLFSDPDPTHQLISDPDPDPTHQLISDPDPGR